MQTIGERLEEARKKKGISIREAAEATKIRGDYLQKFEGNHFDIGLTEIYTRGFLRNYATFLKLPTERLLNDYAALGRGETRQRNPGREIYGRMDVEPVSEPAPEERAAPPPAPEAATPEPLRAQPRRSRNGANLPTGPDPALVFKYVKWASVVVAALVIILVIRSIWGGSSAARVTPAPTPAAAASTERSMTIVALDTVTVTVAVVADGRELFQGQLARGQRMILPRPGPVYVTASEGENVEIEISGKRYKLGFRGRNRVEIQ